MADYTLREASRSDGGDKNPLEYFGFYVQNHSRPRLKFSATPSWENPYFTLSLKDPDGITVPIGKLFEVLDTNSTGDFLLPVLTKSGRYTYTCSYACSGMTQFIYLDGDIDVTAYEPPSVTAFRPERYATKTDDEGSPYYMLADDGPNVWITLAASVYPLAGKNAWTLYYQRDDTGARRLVDSASNGRAASRVEDRTIDSSTYSAAKNIDVRLILSDYLETVEGVVTVPKAGGYMDVEKFGVAIGMRSGGGPLDKRFEVAQDYRSIFHGGIEGVTNFQRGEVDTGGRWIDGRPIYRYVYDEDVSLSSGVNTVHTFNFLIDQVIRLAGAVQERLREGERFSPLTAAVSTSSPQNQALCVRVANRNALEIEAGSAIVNNNSGSFHATVILDYTKPDGPAKLVRPAAAMTGNSSQGCVASASTVYSSSYPAWRAFSNNLGNSWASRANDAAPYLQLQMDVALKNIAVEIYARKTSTVRNPTAGTIQGSNNGSSWTTIGSFSGWSASLSNGLLGEVACSHTTAYKYVRINFTARSDPSDYVAVGNVKITGEL